MRNSLNRAINILLITVLILGSTKITHAMDEVNEYKKGSLTIEHKHNDIPLNDVEVNLFKVAEVSQIDDLILDKDYEKYPISLDNVKENDTRDTISQTLATYTKLDNIKKYASGRTDSKGYVKFSNLEKAMYLVIVEDAKLNNKIISTKPFLVSIPSVDPKDNTLVYDVKSETKTDETDKDDQKDLSVKKIWENNQGVNRPKVIVVELYKDNKLYDTVELSEENNWYHKWENLEKDCEYIIKEKDVPDKYYVTYEEYGNEVIITNTYTDDPTEDIPTDNEDDSSDNEDDSSDKLPQTGTLWWPVPILLIAGMILMMLGISKRDKE